MFPILGASAATMLIFILPAAFYLRIVRKEPLRSPQKIGVSHPDFFQLLSYVLALPIN